jgi:hypothetical protein
MSGNKSKQARLDEPRAKLGYHRGVSLSECDLQSQTAGLSDGGACANGRLSVVLARKKPAILVAAAILCFASVSASAADIHDGDTGYIANSSIWFTNETDLAVWKRVRQAFAPKDVQKYKEIILGARQAWQFIAGPLKVKVISYLVDQHEINVKMLTEGRLADSEWWVEDKDYSITK